MPITYETRSPLPSSAADECARAQKHVDLLRDAAARAFADLSLALDSGDKPRMMAAMGSAKLKLADALSATARAARSVEAALSDIWSDES